MSADREFSQCGVCGNSSGAERDHACRDRQPVGVAGDSVRVPSEVIRFAGKAELLRFGKSLSLSFGDRFDRGCILLGDPLPDDLGLEPAFDHARQSDSSFGEPVGSATLAYSLDICSPDRPLLFGQMFFFPHTVGFRVSTRESTPASARAA